MRREPSSRPGWQPFQDASQSWLSALCSALPEDGVVVADSLLGVWLHRLLAPPAPRRLRHPWGTGTLGAALPAAIGAKLARPDAEVTALAGDGAFLYSATELAALRALGLRITVVVANDNAFGAVRDNLRHAYGRSSVHELTNPSFPDLARAFGLVGVRCDRPEELDAVLAAARARAESTLVEIPLLLHPPRGAFA